MISWFLVAFSCAIGWKLGDSLYNNAAEIPAAVEEKWNAYLQGKDNEKPTKEVA